MSQLDTTSLNLESIGITGAKEIFYNLSYDELFAHETAKGLEGFEKAQISEFGALNIDTGKFTGRSPKDKYVVEDDITRDTVWWKDEGTGSDTNKLSQETWDQLKELSLRQLNSKKLYVMDGFCGANPETRICVRLVCEVAWQAHFFKNMFIRPTDEEIASFKPDWTILNSCKTQCDDFEKFGMNSSTYIAFNIGEHLSVIGGSWYGGEMKKGIFSLMNYWLPLKGIGAFHCSANEGEKGDTALFFGLSGTGKTTLSTDPKRKLVGDDEHGWDNDGIFNFEGGCYAKCINLSEEKEPGIYKAIKRDALLENIDIDESGKCDFDSAKKTQNTRVSYPIYHIDNIVKPISKGAHPKNIVFLTCDAYGVLPPVAKLSKEQAKYHYLAGYTAKVAGTERGVTEPQATFSACFGGPFLSVHPTKYGEILGKKMEEHGSNAYLVNTGWTGGAYGVGERMSLPETRRIIDAILDGTLENAEYETLPVFNLEIPKEVPGVELKILNPRNAWGSQEEFDKTIRVLAKKFITNFEKYATNEGGKALVAAGPQI